jgi:hypothetical protein
MVQAGGDQYGVLVPGLDAYSGVCRGMDYQVDLLLKMEPWSRTMAWRK